MIFRDIAGHEIDNNSPNELGNKCFIFLYVVFEENFLENFGPDNVHVTRIRNVRTSRMSLTNVQRML